MFKKIISNKVLLKFLLTLVFNYSFSQPVDQNELAVTSLTKTGSSRATAYIDSNKIIETKNKIFVTYLIHKGNKDYIALREYDKKTEQWLEEFVLDSVTDNHGGGSMVIDSKGYLHIVYGPHVGSFSYRKSKEPLKSNAWSEKTIFGENMTYPSLAINKNDALYLLGRNTISRGTWSIMLFTKKNNDNLWNKGERIFESSHENLPNFGTLKDNPKNLTVKNGYTRWNKSIVIDNKNNIHISFKNYEFLPRNENYKFTDKRNGGSYFVGYMQSKDDGKTWVIDNKKVKLPASSKTIEIVSGNYNPRVVYPNYGISNIAINKNTPYFLYSKELQNSSSLFLTYKKKGKWLHHEIELGRDNLDYLYSPSAISFFKNELYIVATSIEKKNYDKDKLWGENQKKTRLKIIKLDPSYNIIKTFSTTDLNIKSPSWLPSISRCDDYSPKLIFTQGLSKSNKTEVYFLKL